MGSRRASATLLSTDSASAAQSELFGPGTSTAELVEYIRRASATVHHPCSSCRMGPDENAVVDAQLRVRGIANLRVAAENPRKTPADEAAHLSLVASMKA